jgi:hypothetical protein
MILLLLACGSPDPSWHADVQPLLLDHCTRCHIAGGQGPGDFTDLETVRAMGEVMVEQMDAGLMPPPASDPECRDYVGAQVMNAPDDMAQILDDWLQDGSPEGDPDDAPPAPEIQEALVDPDLTVLLQEPYTPLFQDERNAGNEYRCFVLEHGQTDDFYLTAMAPVIDERALVHHMVLFAVEDEFIPGDHGPEGFDCIDNAFISGDSASSVIDGNGMVAGWAPGQVPLELPDGVGIRIRKSQKLVLQLHYFQSEPGLIDQSGYAFNTATADDIHTTLLMAPMGIYGFRIPADDPAYTDHQDIDLPVTMTAWSVFPHMHVLGKAYDMRVLHADGTETCLASSDQWDFDNQLSYTFKVPVTVETGDTVRMSCTWDNSADNPEQFADPPQDVGYGERTDEEMCFGFTLISLGE